MAGYLTGMNLVEGLVNCDRSLHCVCVCVLSRKLDIIVPCLNSM